MIETLQLISTICFVLAGLFFVAAVSLFFLFRIPAVIGSLTGSTARREIDKMQQQSADSGNIGVRMGREIKSRGGHTGQFTETGDLISEQDGETVVLTPEQASETVVLDAGETTILNTADYGLLADKEAQEPIQRIVEFRIEYEIGFAVSREVIEIA